MAVTPMMQQYLNTKAQYKDAILFYRLGDFYEMFFEDAKTASKELELTLTGRDCGEGQRAPMCGVPYHAVDTYLGRLVAKGYKVAICEQTEDPALAKDIVKREVTRIVTPGTVFESELLPSDTNNYLCSLYIFENGAGLSFADISTGDIYSTSIDSEDTNEKIFNELAKYSPREIITNIDENKITGLCEYAKRQHAFITYKQIQRFDAEKSNQTLKKMFGYISSDWDLSVVCSAGALADYITETQKSEVNYFKPLMVYSSAMGLEINSNTRRNLELCESMRSKEKNGTLLWVLDKTKSAMGGRLLRKWVETPLVNVNQIVKRQKAVGELFGDFMLREELSENMKHVLDLERLMSKVVYGSAGGRDLRSIEETIGVIPEIHRLLSQTKSEELREIYSNLDVLSDIKTLIHSSIVDEPPFSIREGGIIAEGFNSEVDRLNGILKNSKQIVKDLEAREIEKTGIKKLKVAYNRVFGYYIEISKANNEPIPDEYIRKQTLANCERYITPELKELEKTILTAADRISAIEYEIFQSIREKIAAEHARVQKSAELLAKVDVLCALAEVASNNNYVCPEVDYSDVIEIKDGRHPVVEAFTKDTFFVPNDTLLDTSQNRMMLITGPNMAGKSTYMRQVAIITVMAQLGSFVPAREARIGVVDKIFTRIGASDDLASGQSTFMLEMTEVAYILRNATKQSLIIYDEIGRGTSTFDGMSIAKAVAEYSAGKKIGAKTMFATHYHELTSLETEAEGIKNYNIAAKKKGDTLTFLRKIVKGATDDSYGIEVAMLAGVPSNVIKRAKEVLNSLESGDVKTTPSKPQIDDLSGNLTFDMVDNSEVIEKIKNVDLNTLTPIEALSFLFELKKNLDI